MANEKIIILRAQAGGGFIHEAITPADTPVDGNDNPLFVVGVTEVLQLPSSIQVSPNDGDLWREGDELRVRLGGVTYRVGLEPII